MVLVTFTNINVVFKKAGYYIYQSFTLIYIEKSKIM